MIFDGPLLCTVGVHRPVQPAIWNNGYYVTHCAHCVRELYRPYWGFWRVPKKVRIVWCKAPPLNTQYAEVKKNQSNFENDKLPINILDDDLPKVSSKSSWFDNAQFVAFSEGSSIPDFMEDSQAQPIAVPSSFDRNDVPIPTRNMNSCQSPMESIKG